MNILEILKWLSIFHTVHYNVEMLLKSVCVCVFYLFSLDFLYYFNNCHFLVVCHNIKISIGLGYPTMHIAISIKHSLFRLNVPFAFSSLSQNKHSCDDNMPCVCSAATPNVCVNRRSTGWCSPSLLFYLSKYISDNISDVCLTLHGSQAKLLRAKLPIFCRSHCVASAWLTCDQYLIDWQMSPGGWLCPSQTPHDHVLHILLHG